MKKFILVVLAALYVLPMAAQELTVATMNVRLFSYGDGKKYNGWWHRGGYLCDLVKAQRFDIFGAQEVKIKQMESLREQLPAYDYIGVGRDDGKEAGEFCPVFYRVSRLKKLDGGTFWLSETPDKASRGWDGACNRVCSWGSFQDKVTKAKFYFLNTHIENRGAEAKTKGIELVMKFIKEHCKGAPVIVTGDMNVNQGSEWYNIFLKDGRLVDSYEATTTRFAPSGTFSTFTPTRYSTNRIDHIFVSKDVDVASYSVMTLHYWRATDEEIEEGARHYANIEERPVHLLSDHYPVQVKVWLKGAKRW